MIKSDTTCSKSKDSSHKKQTPCGKNCDNPVVVVDGWPSASVCCESLPFSEDGAVSAFATPCAQSSARTRWSAPLTQARLSNSAVSANHIELMIRFIGKDTRLLASQCAAPKDRKSPAGSIQAGSLVIIIQQL